MALADAAEDFATGHRSSHKSRLQRFGWSAASGLAALLIVVAGFWLWRHGRIIELTGWTPLFGARQELAAASWLSLPGLWWCLAAFIMWVLAEVLTRRQRFAAPSIVLAILFAGFAGHAAFAWLTFSGFSSHAAPLSASATLMAFAAHYLRFRLPFTIVPVALAGWLFAVGAVSIVTDFALDARQAGQGVIVPVTTLLYGLAMFVLAMRIDRNARAGEGGTDTGFWLHGLAAPLIVLPVAGPLFDRLIADPTSFWTAVALFGMGLGAATLSLLANRIALLAAAILYPILAAALLVAKGQDVSFTAVAGLVGGLELLAVAAGVYWSSLRQRLVNLLAPAWRAWLPG
jgi:hypothetical protein